MFIPECIFFGLVYVYLTNVANSEIGIWNLEFGIWNLEFGIWKVIETSSYSLFPISYSSSLLVTSI
jgi:hypothetical protein